MHIVKVALALHCTCFCLHINSGGVSHWDLKLSELSSIPKMALSFESLRNIPSAVFEM